MAEQEVDIISHLLDMERNASEVLNQAQSEAEKRISAAKSRADQQFKAQYEKIVADEESRFASETSAVSQKYDADISAYKERLAASNKDIPSFNALLDTLLFAS
ncbi:MAG: hypothetical protein IJP62_03135 [Treponema sp.]|nr:hypothetical protein [Treponema sp.]